ncbi:hypothetical protein BTJ40_06720 [Microbulbifer sp. A4B17]|nr:hypothetical protein BTJ40_06720 [Microbulbifer sp. A4B17]
MFAGHQRLFANALVSFCQEYDHSTRVITENNSRLVVTAIGNPNLWNLILLDELFIRSSVDLLDKISQIKNRVPVAILADPVLTSRADIFLRCGIDGILNKEDDIESFICGCRAIAAGQTWFARPWYQEHVKHRLPPTPRQLQVLTLLAKGLSNKQIAAYLNCTENTIKVHLRTIYRSLNVRTRVECLKAAAAEGWLS